MGKCILAGHPPIGEEGVTLPLVLDAALSQTPDGTTWELPKNFFDYSEIVVVGSFSFQNSGYSPRFHLGDDTTYYIAMCGVTGSYSTVQAVIRPRHCGTTLFYEQQQCVKGILGGKLFPGVPSDANTNIIKYSASGAGYVSGTLKIYAK
jgi:hypothetical protein